MKRGPKLHPCPALGSRVKLTRHAVMRVVERHDAMVRDDDQSITWAICRAQAFLKKGILKKGVLAVRFKDAEDSWCVPMGDVRVLLHEEWVAILKPVRRSRNYRLVTAHPGEGVPAPR